MESSVLQYLLSAHSCLCVIHGFSQPDYGLFFFFCLGSSLEIIITTSKNKLNQHKNKQMPPRPPTPKPTNQQTNNEY